MSSLTVSFCTDKEAYEEKNGILGYRQMTIKLNRENDFHVNQKAHLQADADFRFEIRMPQKKEKLYKIHSSGNCRKCVEQGIFSRKLRRKMAYRRDRNEIWCQQPKRI